MRNLLAKLGLIGDDPSAESPAKPKPGAAAARIEFGALQRRLDSLLSRRRERLEDVVYQINLAGIRERLGDEWNAERYNDKVKSVIERALGPNDICVPYDEGSFLLIFPLLGRREGQLKSEKICHDVEATLFGSQMPPRLLDLKQIVLDNNGTVRSADCPDLSSIIAELVRDADPAPEPTVHEPIRPSVEPHDVPWDLSDVKFIYRPMLTLQTKIVSTFITIPILQTSDAHFECGYHVLESSESPTQIMALDRLSLVRTLDELKSLTEAGGKSLFVVPVHFETLANNSRSREYSQFCAERIPGFERRIIFEINHLPPKVPQGRLMEIVAMLAPFSRAVIALFPSDTEFLDFRNSGLHAVGIDLYLSPKRERVLMEEMDRFVELARRSNLRTSVQGIRSLSLLTSAISSGFDYVAGHALGAACHHAEDIRRFALDDLYSSIIDTYASDNAASGSPDVLN